MSQTAQDASFEARVEHFARTRAALIDEIGRVIVGHEEAVDQAIVCLLAGGHALLEGVPGLGKTLLVRTLAGALDLSFARIQFTPDLMPSDITGTDVVSGDGARRGFEFRPGPIFAHLVLADEINRATPKTQSALLEAMAERTVSVSRTTHALPEPFLVLATQNPLEMEGTYPLPEAQLDRFLLKIEVASPGPDELGEILRRTTAAEVPGVRPAAGAEDILAMRRTLREVLAGQDVIDYIARIVCGTHPHRPEAPQRVGRYVRNGASPRAAQAILLAAKARAASSGRAHVSVEDIAPCAPAALRHRLILSFQARADGVGVEEIVRSVLDEVPPAPLP